MMHSAPRAAFAAYPVVSPYQKKALARPISSALETAKLQRPTVMTRRYETSWLSQDGHVESATRVAPALPQFEEAFSALARGTLIETTTGLMAIEDLEPGMKVPTGEGRIETITWIGSMTLFPPNTIAGLAPVKMTRITADAFGQGRPMPDLLLGPQARVFLRSGRCLMAGYEAAYAPARNLIDGESIVEVTPVAPVTVFHIVLERHGSLRCAGIEVESYHPGRAHAENFDAQLADMFIAMFPNMSGFADFGALAHPRLSADEVSVMNAA